MNPQNQESNQESKPQTIVEPSLIEHTLENLTWLIGYLYVQGEVERAEQVRDAVKMLQAQPVEPPCVQYAPKKYSREEVQAWRYDIAQAAAEIIERASPSFGDGDWSWLVESIRNLAQAPVGNKIHEPWVPYLVDRADGVAGHYAICRINPGRGTGHFQEAWNLWSHKWSSASEAPLTLEQATELLKNIEIPTKDH